MNPRFSTKATMRTPCASGMTTRSNTPGRWSERGRLAILTGWLISMFGIVLYCLTMLSGVHGSEVLTIQEGGWKGMAALLLLVTGVLLWFYGAVASLRELEWQEPQEPQDKGWGATF
ncbi:MAG: hypothetical protein RL695_53 [Pseudomonadota bacterium]|jgi:hypothetical protein